MSGIKRKHLEHFRNARGRFTTYTTHRTVTYSKGRMPGGGKAPPRELRMLESSHGGHYVIVLGYPAGGNVFGDEITIEVASTKQEAYRMLDAAENVLKAVGWRLVEEVNA